MQSEESNIPLIVSELVMDIKDSFTALVFAQEVKLQKPIVPGHDEENDDRLQFWRGMFLCLMCDSFSVMSGKEVSDEVRSVKKHSHYCTSVFLKKDLYSITV
ncbi:hypothetical protein Tco_1112400 [Tanacetum coccineum]|uniref:Uncharacterized protein n=1 Tax=Tanacetum coccineum TaxID=301880 RepID=A0ABQ5IPD7_9ASTR